MTEQYDWDEFYKLTVGGEPREPVLTALANFGNAKNESLFGIDLGCGAGRDTIAMLKEGWRVLAIDGDPNFHKWLDEIIPPEARPRLETMTMSFEELNIPPADLINASYSLPFCPKDKFSTMWNTIINALNNGGRFSGHFFGNEDQWAINPMPDLPTAHFTRSEVEGMLSTLEIEYFDERNEIGGTADGSDKHWHVFAVVARKR